MKAKSKRRLFTIVANLITIIALLAGVAYAAVVNIDTFDTGTQSLLVDSSTTTDSNLVDGGTGGDVLGRYREAHLSWVSGDANREVTLKIDTGGTTNDLSFAAEPNAQGAATIIWDGDQNLSAFSATGLGDADLVSSNPANDGILVVVEFADQTGTLKFSGYDDASNYGELAYTINQADNRVDRLELFFPYDDFSVTGTGADWSSLGALKLDIGGDTALDMVVDYIESTNGVREYGDLPDDSFSGVPDYSDVLDAYHIPHGLTLGDNLDTENSYNASSDAFGDDTSDFDDEDGVTPSVLFNLFWVVNVTVNGCPDTSCYLNGWVDRDGDGDFGDTGEHFINNTSGGNSSLSISYIVDSLSAITAGYYYFRFRLCDASTECDNPGEGTTDTEASNGEVEDYRWYMDPTAAAMSSFSAAWDGPDVLVEWQTASEVGMKGFNVWRSTDPASHGLQLNAITIPPQTPGELTGNPYAYTDDTAVPGTAYYYWLETEYVGASSVWYGPTEPTSPFRIYLPLVR